jgi:DNA repair exonuclease SbcCD ATPase subunit
MINLKEQLAPVSNELKRIKELCNEFKEVNEYYEKTVGTRIKKIMRGINADLSEIRNSFRHAASQSPKIATYAPIELHTIIDWRKLK